VTAALDMRRISGPAMQGVEVRKSARRKDLMHSESRPSPWRRPGRQRYAAWRSGGWGNYHPDSESGDYTPARPAFCPDIVIVRLQPPHCSRRDRISDAELFSRPFGTCGVWSHGPGTGVPGYCPMSLRDKASAPPLLSRPPLFSESRPVIQFPDFQLYNRRIKCVE
jgi:hypothetical protein